MREFLLAIAFCLPTPTTRSGEIPIETKKSEKAVNVVDKETLLMAFIHVESKGNDKVVNKSSGATGCLQIMPILIDEANRLNKCKKYTLSDRTDRDKSVEIFHLMMERKNPSYDIDMACKVWNPNGKQSYTDSIKKKYNELIKFK